MQVGHGGMGWVQGQKALRCSSSTQTASCRSLHTLCKCLLPLFVMFSTLSQPITLLCRSNEEVGGLPMGDNSSANQHQSIKINSSVSSTQIAEGTSVHKLGTQAARPSMTSP
jgi:hypothetical protein